MPKLSSPADLPPPPRDFLIWVDRIKEGRFEDTNKLFVPPVTWDYRVTPKWEMPQYEAELIREIIQPKERKFNHAYQKL